MKIAIIGSGISGLALGYILDKNHDIQIFEKESYIGGHCRTINAEVENQKIPVDTGFIVFNKKNYPHLTSLFEHLGVKYEKSKMSFGVSIQDENFEYGTGSINSLLAQRSNIFRLDFWKMLKDILKFFKHSKEFAENAEHTIADLLNYLKLGDWFKNYFLLPMAGSIWSANPKSILDFPSITLINFFENHGLLTVKDQPQWHTVTGGSKEYVKLLTESFHDKINLSTAIQKVERQQDKVVLTDENGIKHEFDRVVFACHSDQALTMIANPTKDEKEILGNIKYQENKVTLHVDQELMPNNKRAWSSWNYIDYGIDQSLTLTYWMNNLQNLNTTQNIFVTVNPTDAIDRSKILNEHIFHHPVFDLKAMNAQKKIDTIQGVQNTWFVGAYSRYGFHEDGILSAVKVAENMGESLPW